MRTVVLTALAAMLLISPASAGGHCNIAKGETYRIQGKLAELGFFRGEFTGHYGYQTEQAVIAFQRDRGLEPDGCVGADSYRALFGRGRGWNGDHEGTAREIVGVFLDKQNGRARDGYGYDGNGHGNSLNQEAVAELQASIAEALAEAHRDGKGKRRSGNAVYWAERRAYHRGYRDGYARAQRW